MTYDEWIQIGLEHGFVGPPVCYIHENLPMTEEEADDPETCVFVIRVYENEDHRRAIEAVHPSSVVNRKQYEKKI